MINNVEMIVVFMYELTKGQAIFMAVSIAVALLIAIYSIYKDLRK